MSYVVNNGAAQLHLDKLLCCTLTCIRVDTSIYCLLEARVDMTPHRSIEEGRIGMS